MREAQLAVGEGNGLGNRRITVVLPSGALLQQGHLGLTGMAERARLFEGELRVETAPENGTTVILRLPRPASSPTVN
ncbi:MAG TPA: hypothetical protein VHS28_03880 [Chloroflexota bacterium]|nr:hypothetical protein [Chloroflexota bacterium]